MNSAAAPLVSVVIPTYNSAKFITQTIDSVLSQTYSNYEIIVVDDGSTDASNSICHALAQTDERIRLVWQRNKGLAAARNTGIRHSMGEYIAFLDSDDLWHPEKLSQHVKLLNQYTNVGVSYSASKFINEQGQEIGLSQQPKCQNIQAKDVFLRNPVGNGSAPVIRKAVFTEISFKTDDDIQFFHECLRQSEDIECWVRIATTTNWQFAGIAQALTYYRVNNGGLSANVEKQFESWQSACKLMAEYAPEFIARYQSLAKSFGPSHSAVYFFQLSDFAFLRAFLNSRFLSIYSSQLDRS